MWPMHQPAHIHTECRQWNATTSVTDVPLVTELMYPAASTPLQAPKVSWSTLHPGGSLQPTGSGWQHPTRPAGPQPGVTISPSGETFPQKLVEKVRAGQYVDMKELLTDNVSLVRQLETAGLMLGPARPRLREVSSLPMWCYCFLGYMAITSDPATRDQLAYARLIIREAQRHGGLGWLNYDRAFRQQAVGDPSLQ